MSWRHLGRRSAFTTMLLAPAGAYPLDPSCMNMHNSRNFMREVIVAADAHQVERRGAIVRFLREGLVRRQADLVRLLRKAGHEVTQSSVSRDLRDLGVLKASGRYVLPPDEPAAVSSDFAALAPFVRGVRRAGPSLTVLRTTTGSAQSVAVAIDRAQWPEVAGTLSGDDTIFIATASAQAQDELVRRLQALFKV